MAPGWSTFWGYISCPILQPVEDVDATYEEVRAKGVEFIRTPETRSWGMRCAHFKDPDGNAWEINKWLEEN